jgi:hypothetical protein
MTPEEALTAAYQHLADLATEAETDPNLSIKFGAGAGMVSSAIGLITDRLRRIADGPRTTGRLLITDENAKLFGWDWDGRRNPTGVPFVEKLLDHLQDAQDCNYSPGVLLSTLGVDERDGSACSQFTAGRIVTLRGLVLERSGALGLVWACVSVPACFLLPGAVA